MDKGSPITKALKEMICKYLNLDWFQIRKKAHIVPKRKNHVACIPSNCCKKGLFTYICVWVCMWVYHMFACIATHANVLWYHITIVAICSQHREPWKRRRFADHTFKLIFLSENSSVLIWIPCSFLLLVQLTITSNQVLTWFCTHSHDD